MTSSAERSIVRGSSKSLSELQVVQVHHHTFAYGASHALADFLVPRAGVFALLRHPFEHRKYHASDVMLYVRGTLRLHFKAPALRAPETLLFAKDFLLTLYFAAMLKRRFDLFIGVDCLNALAGLILKTIGIARCVVFYVIDYTPQRFKNPLKNLLYHEIEKFSARNSDRVWVISRRIEAIMLSSGAQRCKTIIVPSGGWIGVTHPESERRSTKRILFMGFLDRTKGAQIAVEAMPKILEKVPDARLVIAGSGPFEATLRELVNGFGVSRSVDFVGYVARHDDLVDLMHRCAVGLAPYLPDPTSISVYADPGKPKEYLAAGLPVIITRVPEMAQEIEDAEAGVVIRYDANELANVIVKLLEDSELQRRFRQNALQLAMRYDWNAIFTEALDKTFHSFEIRSLCQGH